MTEENERNDSKKFDVSRRDVMKAAGASVVVGSFGGMPASATVSCNLSCSSKRFETYDEENPQYISTTCGTIKGQTHSDKGCIKLVPENDRICLTEVKIKGGSEQSGGGTNTYNCTEIQSGNNVFCTPEREEKTRPNVSNLEVSWCCLPSDAPKGEITADCDGFKFSACVCPGDSVTVDVNGTTYGPYSTSNCSTGLIEDSGSFGETKTSDYTATLKSGGTTLDSVDVDCATNGGGGGGEPTDGTTLNPDKAISWIAFCGCSSYTINCVTYDEDGEIDSVNYTASSDCTVLYKAGQNIYYGDGSFASGDSSDSSNPCSSVVGTSGTKIEAAELKTYDTC